MIFLTPWRMDVPTQRWYCTLYITMQMTLGGRAQLLVMQRRRVPRLFITDTTRMLNKARPHTVAYEKLQQLRRCLTDNCAHVCTLNLSYNPNLQLVSILHCSEPPSVEKYCFTECQIVYWQLHWLNNSKLEGAGGWEKPRVGCKDGWRREHRNPHSIGKWLCAALSHLWPVSCFQAFPTKIYKGFTSMTV